MHQLIELKTVSPNILFDIRYASAQNFMNRQIYPFPACFLQEKSAKRLHRVQLKLEGKGLGLKIFDAYRPLSVQKIFWEVVPDPRYVADPKEGSKHNRGSAVDLTLVKKGGRELAMPTEFDDFSEKAHRNYSLAPVEAIKNRQILENAMVDEGFLPLPTEWWHFDDPEWMCYPLLDISFEELTR